MTDEQIFEMVRDFASSSSLKSALDILVIGPHRHGGGLGTIALIRNFLLNESLWTEERSKYIGEFTKMRDFFVHGGDTIIVGMINAYLQQDEKYLLNMVV